MLEHNTKAYLLFISTVLFMISITVAYFITDPDVSYDSQWYYGTFITGFISMLLTVYTFLLYLKVNPYYAGVDNRLNFMFCVISVYLLVFGLSSIHVNELVINSKNNDYY